MSELHHLHITTTPDGAPGEVTLDGRPLLATSLRLHLDANDMARATIEVPVSIDFDGGAVTSITGGGIAEAAPKRKPSTPVTHAELTSQLADQALAQQR